MMQKLLIDRKPDLFNFRPGFLLPTAKFVKGSTTTAAPGFKKKARVASRTRTPLVEERFRSGRPATLSGRQFDESAADL